MDRLMPSFIHDTTLVEYCIDCLKGDDDQL